MSKLGIGTGITPDDGNGDSLLDGAVKINSNFNEIYSYFGDGTNLSGSWQKVSSGINTTLNVGIGTTNPRFALEVGSVGASGTSLYVNGDARVTGILTVGSSSITLDGSSNTINVGSGVTINGNTGIISATDFYASGMQVGVITASTIIYEGATLYNAWQETSAGINTLSNVGIGTTNPTSALTVKGNTSLETLSVSGISTFNAVISAPQLIGDVSASDIYVADTLEVAGVSTFAGITTVTGQTLFAKQLNVSGVITATNFVGDGSGLTNLPGGGGGSGVGVQDDGSTVGTATTINFGTGLSVSAVSAGIVTVTAIPTNNFYDGGVVTGNIILTTANKNQLVPVSTGSSISITLPAGSGLSPGDGFTIVDVGSSDTSSGNAATFNITVTPVVGDRIMGGTGPLIIDENGASVKLVWMGSTYDWRIV